MHLHKITETSHKDSVLQSHCISIDIKDILQNMHHDRLFVLTDKNTHALCLPKISHLDEIRAAQHIVIEPNDTNKTIENLSLVWCFLSQNRATRHSLLINLGGGMVTDLGGFAAATFKRGIRYINIPTTVMASVDASVGGKTAINLGNYKNEIGAFYPPEHTLLTSIFLDTLPKTAILSGYAEMLKHALIDSDEEWKKIVNYRFSTIDYEKLNQMIFHSVAIKNEIVKKDPHENNIRKALNLGHTIGHAFESLALEKGQMLSHGFAVAYGLIGELYLSYLLLDFPKEKLLQTIRFIKKKYGAFPLSCDDYEKLYELMTHDKKNIGDTIHFSLLEDIGKIKIDQCANKKLIFEALDFYRDTVGL